MSPSELAQVRQWAAERGQTLSHFLKQAADAYVRDSADDNRNGGAKEQTALTVNISNRLTDIERVLDRLNTELVSEQDPDRPDPQSIEAAQTHEVFQALHAELRRILQALAAQTDRASRINAAQEDQLRLLLAGNDDTNRHLTFTERLMRRMRL